MDTNASKEVRQQKLKRHLEIIELQKEIKRLKDVIDNLEYEFKLISVS